MEYISNKEIGIEQQIRESATLVLNQTGTSQPSELSFVQFDDYHSVGSDGCIYQLVDQDAVDQNSPVLYYKSERGNVYNYAEDSEERFDEEDMSIFEHCKEQAELAEEFKA